MRLFPHLFQRATKEDECSIRDAEMAGSVLRDVYSMSVASAPGGSRPGGRTARNETFGRAEGERLVDGVLAGLRRPKLARLRFVGQQ
jgi:hypothetical protein